MTITAREKDLLNRMNSTAVAVQLGTLIENAESVVASEIALASGSVLVGNGSGVAAANAVQHFVKYSGTFTTAGGDATESITVTGATATDIALVTVKTAGGTPRSIVAAAATTNAITVTLSGDPSTDHVLAYLVLRAST